MKDEEMETENLMEITHAQVGMVSVRTYEEDLGDAELRPIEILFVEVRTSFYQE